MEKPSRRRRWPVVALVGVLVVGGAGVAFVLAPRWELSCTLAAEFGNPGAHSSEQAFELWFEHGGAARALGVASNAAGRPEGPGEPSVADMLGPPERGDFRRGGATAWEWTFAEHDGASQLVRVDVSRPHTASLEPGGGPWSVTGVNHCTKRRI